MTSPVTPSASIETRARNALALFSFEDPEAAIAEARGALADAINALGPSHRVTLALRNQVAAFLGASGAAAEAVEQLECLLADLPEQDPATRIECVARFNLAGGLVSLGRHQAALVALQELIARAERSSDACGTVLIKAQQLHDDVLEELGS